MQQNFKLQNMTVILGDIEKLQDASPKVPFDMEIVNFLNLVSKTLLADKKAKAYSDIVTLAFWMRKASVETLRKRFAKEEAQSLKKGEATILKVGRGTLFHIAPSNVPVNYAYSLVAGLLCGNKNIVRIPSKDFEQVTLINQAIQRVLDNMPEIASYICLVKYGHDIKLNDALSAIADVRIVWGGDNTISELRKSPLKPRATEITFADRYSIAVIDADAYLNTENKTSVAKDFYNDTYLTDQNACTSPRIIIWIGNEIEKAKSVFWKELHQYVSKNYQLSGVQAVNKLTSAYLIAAKKEGIQKTLTKDNLITRIQVSSLSSDLLDYKDNSGYFFEYDCNDIRMLEAICNDTRCQTLAYLGDSTCIAPLLTKGISGIDRIVPIGKTMNFDLIWDGYNLFEQLTRNIFIL